MAGNYNRKDHLYKKAKAEGYRSRAAYKLLELDNKFKLLKPGNCVLELGCFPGGWLQIAQEKVGPKGLVVGIDLKAISALSVKSMCPKIVVGDILEPSSQQALIAACEGRTVDVLLSDMSPQLSGIRFRDVARSAELVETALQMATRILRQGGALVAKVFPGPESDELAPAFKKLFNNFSREYLKSSRSTSTELYFVGRGFSASGNS